MTVYHLLQVKDGNSNNTQTAISTIRNVLAPLAAADDQESFGIFTGVFGLSTNELYWITTGIPETGSLAKHARDSGLQVQLALDLVPTVRPTDHTPLSKPGIYVFRWFDVLNKDVDEIASLSEQAWVSFEGDFDSQIQGLFALQDRQDDKGRMLLLTWYRNLTVWQDSRAPSKEAMNLFIKRHALTIEALPIATRLRLLTK
jgi:hypothetical protein